MASASTSSRAEPVEPVFFLNSEVPQHDNNWLTTYEICTAVSEVVDEPKPPEDAEKSVIDGAQKIGNLWRIYLLDSEARVTLLSNGITLRGQQVTLRNRNPFTIAGFENVPTTRLFIRNIPLSFDNEEIAKVLKAKGVQFAGPLKYSRARTPDNKLTNFKTGDRFVDVVVPSEPLPKKIEFGMFNGSLYHKEQKKANDDKECGNCMMKGHLRKDCKNEIVCYQCRNVGHKKGDDCCPSMQGVIDEGGDEGGDDGDDEESNSDTSEVNEVDDDEYKSMGEPDGSQKDEDAEKTVSQMLKTALTEDEQAQSSVTPKPSEKKKGDQKLISGFFHSSLQAGQSTSRSSSPASRRKMGDRTPEDTDPNHKGKAKKKKKHNKVNV